MVASNQSRTFCVQASEVVQESLFYFLLLQASICIVFMKSKKEKYSCKISLSCTQPIQDCQLCDDDGKDGKI